MSVSRFSLLILIVAFALDQGIKTWVLFAPELNGLRCLDGPEFCGRVHLFPPLDIATVWNRSQSGLPDHLRNLILLAALMLSGMFACGLLVVRRPVAGAGLAMFVAGGLSNTFDRFRFDATLVYVDVSSLSFPWLFSLADLLVTAGFAMLIVDQYALAGVSHQPPELRAALGIASKIRSGSES